jgi:hypothetical protein
MADGLPLRGDMGKRVDEDRATGKEFSRIMEKHRLRHNEGDYFVATLLNKRTTTIWGYYSKGLPRSLLELLEYKLADPQYAERLAKAQVRR